MKNLLSACLEKKDFFKLKEEIEKTEKQLPEKEMLYYKMYLEYAFNNIKQSNTYIDELLGKYKDQLDNKIIAETLKIKSDNCFRGFYYKEAAEAYKQLLSEYQHEINKTDIDEYKNEYAFYKGLQNVEPQKMAKSCSIEINSYRNQFNHLMIPVECGGVKDNFILDTGANVSVVTETYAKKMGLPIYQSDADVGTSTGKRIKIQLSVAKKIIIGKIIFENVVFMCVPDKDLTFPDINLEIHGVIGFPIIQQIGEIHINKNGNIFIPEHYQKNHSKNIFLDQLFPIIKVVSVNEKLLLNFDTGANNSELSKKYYEDHETEIKNNGIFQNGERGGAGGTVNVKKYILKNFSYQIGNKNGILPEIEVILQEYGYSKFFDGVIGQDIIMQHEKMVINLKEMYIDFV